MGKTVSAIEIGLSGGCESKMFRLVIDCFYSSCDSLPPRMVFKRPLSRPQIPEGRGELQLHLRLSSGEQRLKGEFVRSYKKRGVCTEKLV